MLESAGFAEKGGKGSHRNFIHHNVVKPVTIPGKLGSDAKHYLIKAVKVANENKLLLSKMLIERDLIRVDHDTLQTYLGLYANDDSIELSQLQFKALNKLYSLGFEHGFYDDLIKAEDYLIPSEYKELRNS